MQLVRLPTSFKTLICVAAGLVGMAILAIGLTVWALRADATQDALRDSSNIATVFAEQATHAVQSLDLTLNELHDRFAWLGIDRPDDLRRHAGTREIHAVLLGHLAQVPQADVITIVDSSGQTINSTRTWPDMNVAVSDRDYMTYLRANNDPDLFISIPVQARVTGAWTVFFSRRLNTTGGDFAGVATIGVELKFFQQVYNSITSLRGQSFLLLRSDGTVLVRYPDVETRAGQRMPAGTPWYAMVKAGGGVYRSPGNFDAEARLIAVKPLRNYPLVINVGMLESTALANWRWRATLIGIGTLVVVLCAAHLLTALTIQVRRLAESEASLAERESRLAEKSREIEGVNLRLDAAVNNMSQGLCMFDRDGRLVICNERYLRMYRLSAAAVRPGCAFFQILECRMTNGTFSDDPDDYIAGLRAKLAQGHSVYVTCELDDGRVIAVLNQPTANGGWVATHEDITERQRAEARIAHMARHDALTDLANRMLFRERMDDALSRLRRNGEEFAIFVFDLDLFKSVNDSLGHPVGDALLKAVATRLETCAKAGDTVGRVGGDEFAIIQTAESDPKRAAIALGDELLEKVSAPYQIDGHRIVIGISIGIAMAPKDGDDAGQLLKNADLALYRAKSEGRKDYRFFEPEMDAEARLHRALEIDLRNALMRDEFVLYYQTLVDIATHRTCGAEALIRWRHPQHGLIPPDQFIPLAEEIGVIIPLGEWILRTACAEAARWPDHVKLAVNLSPVQFRSGNLVDLVGDALATSGLPPDRLELEVTESVLLQKDAGNIDTLHRLSDLGVCIVLDDFGTGYSSLSYLRTFPFAKIKIDRSFVAELSHRADCGAIVCAITGLGQTLDVITTAEGVETPEQLELLRAAGCRQAQGYLFSRPCPADEIDFTADQRTGKVA
jgi:diguanylate cyclase (GGDEF)-like protein